MNEENFIKKLNEYNITLTEHQLHQFNLYYETLVEWNEKMNLTAITDRESVYLKHFFDSISASFKFDFQDKLSICDVGAGAGFPSIPLKIVFPHLNITIVDSLKKRITFLNHLAEQLQLDDVTFYHDRAESFGQNKKHRESYDVVIARAVARTSVLSELCLPLVKVNGHFIMMKGANFAEEKEIGNKAVKTLGGEWKNIYSFLLPVENSERNIAIIKKVNTSQTKSPRKPGVPNKEPIE